MCRLLCSMMGRESGYCASWLERCERRRPQRRGLAAAVRWILRALRSQRVLASGYPQQPGAVRFEALSFGPRDEGLFYMAPVRNALGQLYVTVGLLEQAESLLQDALDAYEKKYGKDHPLTEDVLVNLAALYDGRQDASKAREYAERAQAVHGRSAGYSHVADQPLRWLARATPPPDPPQGQDLQSCGAGVDSPDRP